MEGTYSWGSSAGEGGDFGLLPEGAELPIFLTGRLKHVKSPLFGF
jgi:hypothetical protein